MSDNLAVVLGLVAVVIGSVAIGWFLYDNSIQNNKINSNTQIECVQHGGSYIKDVGCLMLVEVKR